MKQLTTRKTGRPLSFDRAEALHRAMLAFWQSGYETTSVSDLTAAMGVTAPSLYAAFGDKKRLFLEAARLYAGDLDAMAQAIEDAPTARDAVRDFMRSAALTYTGDDTPKGCLLASAAASTSDAAADVRKEVADIRRSIAGLLTTRIERDIAAGLLPPTADAPALSGLALAVTQGMSVLARDGVSRASLLAIADAALAAWPSQAVIASR